MGLRDYKDTRYNYRARQNRLHRRRLQHKRVSLKNYYLAFLTLLIILNFIYTTLKPAKAGPVVHTEEVRKVTQPTNTVNAQLTPFRLFQLPFPKVFKAFASEAKPLLIPTPTSSDNWEAFKQEAHAIAKIYDYPANLLIAQAALESAHGTSSFAINRYNYFGIGAYDWQPNEAFVYENPAQSIIDYIYVVKNNFPEAWANRNNPSLMLQLLENNSNGNQYATDPDYISKVESTPEWSTE